MENILDLLKEYKFQQINQKRLVGIVKVLKNNHSDYEQMNRIYKYFVKEQKHVLYGKVVKCRIEYDMGGHSDVFFFGGIVLDKDSEHSIASLVAYLEPETFFGTESELEGFFEVSMGMMKEIREIRDREVENVDAFLA